MDKLEIRRRALYAAAHITFVAAATGCQARQVAEAEREDRRPRMAPSVLDQHAGSGADAKLETVGAPPSTPTQLSPAQRSKAPAEQVAGAAPEARDGCTSQQQTPPIPTVGPLPTAQAVPTPSPTPAVPATQSCTEAAAAVPGGQAFPPAVQLCCAAVIRAAEFARANHTPMPGDHWACCRDNWDSSVCQAWGPPAPPRARSVTAMDRARILSRWS